MSNMFGYEVLGSFASDEPDFMDYKCKYIKGGFIIDEDYGGLIQVLDDNGTVIQECCDLEELQEATKGKLERWANRIAGKGDTPKGETRIERIESYREETVKRCVRCGYNMPEKLFPYYCPGCGCKIMYVSSDFLKSKR